MVKRPAVMDDREALGKPDRNWLIEIMDYCSLIIRHVRSEEMHVAPRAEKNVSLYSFCAMMAASAGDARHGKRMAQRAHICVHSLVDRFAWYWCTCPGVLGAKQQLHRRDICSHKVAPITPTRSARAPAA